MPLFIALPLLALLRTEEWDLERILTLLAGAAVIFGGPLIKSILESRGKSRGAADPNARRAAREKEAEGRRAFEELMRGREPTAPPLVNPTPSTPSRTERASDARAAKSAAKSASAPKPLAEMREMPATPLSGSELDAEEGATDEQIVARTERRERDELERQRAERATAEAIAHAEYAAASSLRENVEPVPVQALRAPAATPAAAASSAGGPRPLFDFRPATDRRAALRRALVLNEVLGAPVTERDSSDARAPLGWRG
jgi:hypothetical protein